MKLLHATENRAGFDFTFLQYQYVEELEFLNVLTSHEGMKIVKNEKKRSIPPFPKKDQTNRRRKSEPMLINSKTRGR